MSTEESVTINKTSDRQSHLRSLKDRLEKYKTKNKEIVNSLTLWFTLITKANQKILDSKRGWRGSKTLGKRKNKEARRRASRSRKKNFIRGVEESRITKGNVTYYTTR